jgi:hypothetical protein
MIKSVENNGGNRRLFLMGAAGALASGLFFPLAADARTRRPDETDDRFSREETGMFGYRKMGHNFISGSGGVIWRPDHRRVLDTISNSENWYLWSYHHPFKDFELYLGALQLDVGQYQYGVSVLSDQVSYRLVSKVIDRQQFESAAEIQTGWVNGSLALAIARDAQSNTLPFLSVERRILPTENAI